MSKQIVIIPQATLTSIVDKKYLYVLNYPNKYKDRISKLISRFKMAYGSIGDCCEKSSIPQATYNKMMELADGILEYCDNNGIMWEDTDHKEFLEAIQMIREAFIDGTEMRLKNIEMHGKDVYDNDGKLTKKGTIEADKFILSYSRRGQFKKDETEEVKQNQSSGINIVFNFSAEQFQQASIVSQQNLEKFKINKNK